MGGGVSCPVTIPVTCRFSAEVLDPISKIPFVNFLHRCPFCFVDFFAPTASRMGCKAASHNGQILENLHKNYF